MKSDFSENRSPVGEAVGTLLIGSFMVALFLGGLYLLGINVFESQNRMVYWSIQPEERMGVATHQVVCTYGARIDLNGSRAYHSSDTLFVYPGTVVEISCEGGPDS